MYQSLGALISGGQSVSVAEPRGDLFSGQILGGELFLEKCR